MLSCIREEQSVLNNRILRRIFGPEKDENGEWRRLHNEELHSLYCSYNIVRLIKSRRLRWTGHAARIQEGRSAFKILTGKHTGNRLLGSPGLDGWTILECIVRKVVSIRGVGLIRFRIGITGEFL